jgi:PAS domain S-box-containing protein
VLLGGLVSVTATIVDLATPAAAVLATAHLLLALIAAQYLSRGRLYIVVAICTLLSLAPLITVDPAHAREDLIERFLAVAALWVVSLYAFKRRETLAALEESRARHDALLGAASDAIITFRETGVIESMNAAAETMFGYKPGRGILMDIRKLLPDVLEVRHEAGSDAIPMPFGRDDGSGQLEAEARHSDGSTFPVEMNVNAIPVAGAPLCFAIIRDITQRKRSERLLRDSQRTLSTLMSNLPGMAYRCLNDDQWTMLFVSQGCHELTGYEPYDLLNNRKISYAKVVFPEDREPVTQDVQLALRANCPFDLTYRIIRADGEVRWVSERGRAVTGAQGKISCLEGFIFDITHLKRAEEALRESEERFRTIADSTPFMVWTTDPDNGCTFVNKRWQEFTGRSEKQELGQGWLETVHAEDRARVSTEFHEASEQWQPFQLEYRMRRHDGAYRWILDAGAPRFAPDGGFTGYVGSAIDITDRKHASDLVLQIARGVSAEAGEDFFRSLAEHLAATLSADMILIGELASSDACDVRTVALWKDGALTDQFSYCLDGTPCARVYETGDFVCLSRTAEEFPTDAVLREEGIEAYVGTTLRDSSGQPRGQLSVMFRRPVENGEFALSLLKIFAAPAAAELERRHNERSLSEQHQRLASIHRLTEAIVCARPLEELYSTTLDELEATLGANRAALLLYDAGGTMRFVAWRGLSEEYRRAVEGHSPWSKEEPDPKPIMVGDAFADGPLAVYREVFTREKIRSLAFFPLTFEGRLLGKFMVYYAEPHQFTSGQVEFARHVAGQLAIAVARQSADQALRTSEQRYRGLFEDSPLAFFDCDFREVRRHLIAQTAATGRTLVELFASHPEETYACLGKIVIADVNQSALQLCNVATLGELQSRLPALVTENAMGALRSLLVTLWGGESLHESEFELGSFERGLRQVVGRTKLISMAAGDWSQVLVSLADVTESRRAADELMRAKRLETAGRLAGQVAHDFNNLLSPLVVYPEMLQARLPADSNCQGMLRDMQNAALQIAEINQELLTLARRGHYTTEILDVNELLRAAIQSVTIPPGISITLRGGERPLAVRGGNAQLLRVLINLINNGIEAIGDRGALMVVGDIVHLEAPLRRYASVKPGPYVRIRITDTGSGIPAGMAEQIFEPFFTTKRTDKHRGTGLGLSVVQSVIGDHEGYVDVDSQPGRGCTFSLYLPLLPSEAVRSAIEESHTRGQAERVLFVDDDPSQQQVASAALERAGYTVEIAASGSEALTMMSRATYDVVVLDMALEGMDGVETLRAIRSVHPLQRAVILTGSATLERAQSVRDLGHCDIVSKPIQSGRLIEALIRASHRPAPAEASSPVAT